MLAQIRVAHGREPDNARFANLIQEILNVNQDAHRMRESEPASTFIPMEIDVNSIPRIIRR